MTKRKLKPIEVDRDTYRIMEKIWGPGKVPYSPTIIDKKIFVSTADPHNDPDWVNMTHYREIREKEVKEDGKQTDSNI